MAEAIAAMRQCVLEMYAGAIGDGEKFHPLAHLAHSAAKIAQDMHSNLDAVQLAVSKCGTTWANQETQENSLRTFLHLSKDKLENEFVLGQVQRAIGRVVEECEEQAARTKAGRVSKEELMFESSIQNLKRMAKELSKITPLDFDIAFVDDANAQVTLGSHGENFCFAIVVDLAKEENCFKSSSVYFLVDDGQWEDEDANRDLLFCLQNMKFGRLKLKLRSMLETELLQAKYPNYPQSIKLMRSAMNEFMQKFAANQSLLSCKFMQQLEGPAVRFFEASHLEQDQMHRIVFLGAREFPSAFANSSDDKLAYLFLVQPDLWIPFGLASKLPCLYGKHPISSEAKKFMEKSYFSDVEEDASMTSALSLLNPDQKTVKYSEYSSRFELKENDKSGYKSSAFCKFEFENALGRGILLSHVMIHPKNLDGDFSELVKVLRQQACVNEILSSFYSSRSGSERIERHEEDRVSVDLSEIPSMLKLSVSTPGSPSLLSLKVFIDPNSASVKVDFGKNSSKTLDNIEASNILQSSLSIPALLQYIKLQR